MTAIELSFQQPTDAAKQLSPAENLELNEMTWSADAGIPTEHQQMVNERIQKSKENPQEVLDWEIASKTLHF